MEPGDIKTLADISKLPFTVKNDLRDNYPFGLCAVKMKDVVRIHASSGTTGKPITGPYTADDLQQWSDCMARNLWSAGVRPDDIIQNAYGMGLFTGGLGFHQGALAVGSTLVPTGAGMTERQITLMQDFKSHGPVLHSLLRPDHGREGPGHGPWTSASCPCGWASSGPSPGPWR